MKIKDFYTAGIASLALLVSACGGSGSVTVNSPAANNANGAGANAAAPNSNQAAASNASPAANANAAPAGNANANKSPAAANKPAGDSEAETIRGKLEAGKAQSAILYFGEESGDYAGYCFANDSEAGRAIMAACKAGEQCEVVATIDADSGCKVPGLEADLSASGRIVKVTSVKTLGRKK